MKELIGEIADTVYQQSKILMWSGLFGFIATVFSPKNRSIMAYIISISTAMPVGALAGVMMYERGFSQGDTFFVVAMIALLCQDLLKFIFSATGFIRKNQETIFKALLDFGMKILRIRRRKDQD